MAGLAQAVQANVLSFYLQKLQRDLEDVVMNEQVLKRLVGYNFPPGTPMPTFHLGRVDDDRLAATAQLMQTLITGGVRRRLPRGGGQGASVFGGDEEDLSRVAADDPLTDREFVLSLRGAVDDAVGAVFLTVCRDLNAHGGPDGGPSEGHHDPELVRLSFTAAITDMSHRFDRSESVRDTCRARARRAGAEYALLDREDDAVLLWWEGRAVTVPLPDPRLTRDGIAAALRQARSWGSAPRPPSVGGPRGRALAPGYGLQR